MRAYGTKMVGSVWIAVLGLLASSLVVLGVAAPANAAPFVATASMPTAPGVKQGVQPDGDWSIAVDQVTGAKWRIWGTGSNTSLQGPGGNAAATWAGLPGDFQANIKYLAVDSGNHHAFAIGPTNTEIVEFDGTTGNIRSNVVRTAVPSGVTGFTEMTVNSVTHKVYLVNTGRNSVYEFVPSTSQWTEIVLPAGSSPAMVAADEANNLVYVTNSGTSSVSVINPTTHTVVNSVSVGATPWGISIDNVHHVAYVANSGGSTISVLDISTTSAVVTSSLSFSTYAPKFVSIDTTNMFLYVGSTTSGVAVVDIQAGNVVTEVSGYGTDIFALAADPVNRLAHYSTRTVASTGQVWYYYSNTIGYIPEITSGAPANGTLGTAYAGHQMTAIGSATITYSKTSGTLPPGLSINSSGAISGTPTAPGVYTFTITADNGYGTDSETYSIHIPTPPPVLSATTFVDGYVSEAYVPDNSGCWYNCPQYNKVTSTWLGVSYAATGIDPFRVTAGSIPPGLTLVGATGEFTGTPTTAGTYTFTITGTNSTLAPVNPTTQTTTRQYSITILPARPPVIDPAVDWDINWQLGSSPTPPYEGGGNSWTQWMSPYLATGSPSATWTISAGALPAGLVFNAGNPDIRGHVTASAGTAYSFTLRATGTNGLYAERTFSGVVTAAPPNFSSTNFTAYEGTPFYFDPSQSVASYNGGSGSAPLTWSYNQSTLDQYPSGMAFNTSTGVVSGTPAAGTSTGGVTGFYSIDMDVTNAAGVSHPNYSLSVQPALPASQKQTITMTEGATLTSGTTYPTVPVAGIAPGGYPYWQPQIGSHIPSWLTIDDSNNGNGTGEMTGTAPSGSAGNYVMVMQYYDNSWNPYYLEVTLQVLPPAPAMAATTTISQNAGASFTSTIVNTGGAAATCSVVNSTSLPTGVSLSVVAGQCVLTGTSAVATGSYQFDVQAANVGANSAAQTSVTSVTLTLQSIPVVVAQTLHWAVATSNSYTVVPSAGATPFSFLLTSTSPTVNWLTLGSSTGALAGTPTTAGTYTATMSVSNTPGTTSVNYTVNTYVVPTVAALALPQPVVGQSYNYQVPAPTVGTGPFTYIATNLPAGLTINAATGVISGTPTTAGTVNLSVSVMNASAYTASLATPSLVSSVALTATRSQSVTTVVQAPVYTSTVTHYVAASGSLSLVPALTSGSPATSWTLAQSSALPNWISLNSTTGALSGTAPSSAGQYNFSVVGSNSVNPDATIAYLIEVQVAPSGLTIAPPAPTVGVPYSYTIPAPTTGTGPFSYTISPANALSGTGLTLSNGVISGTPTLGGVSQAFTIIANNGLSTQQGSGSASSASTTLTNAVVAPAYSPSTLSCPSANLSALGSCVPSQTSTTTPTTNYTVTWSPSAPSGVALNTATGALTGTPTTPGIYTATVTGWTGSNGTGSSGSVTVTVNVTAPPVVTVPSTSFTYGVSSSLTLGVSNSNPAPTSFTSSNLPGWATLNASTGVISGTAPAGTVSPTTFNVTVSNGVGTPTVVPVSIPLVTAAPQLAATTTLSPIAPGSTSSTPSNPNPLTITGGSPGTYALGTNSSGSGNTAPSWVAINSATGVITFTNATATPGTFTFPVTVTNSAGSATTTVSITVADIPILPATLTFTIPVGTAWTHDFANDITSSNGPFSAWQIASSSTAPSWTATTGLRAASNRTGVLSGTPSAAGTDTFTVEVQNANSAGTPSTVVVTINSLVAPAWASAPSVPGVTTGVAYSYQFPAPSSGTGPFTYAATGLPAGLSINPSTGLISGTVTSTTASTITANFTVTATNALGAGSAGSVTPSIAVSTVAPTLPATLNLNATTTSAFSYTFAPTGGSPVVSYSAPSSGVGAMPNALSFSGAVLNGQFTTQGTHTFNVTASAGSSVTTVVAVTVTVVQPPIVVAQVTAPVAPTGTSFTYPASGSIATNSTGITTYAVTSGSLPSWATLNANGTITGTPTTASGPVTVTVTATNSAGSSTHQVTLTSAVPPTALAGGALSPTVNQPMTTSFVPSAGTGPFTYSVTAGSLPAGVTLGSNGVLSGSPTGSGSGSFTVTVTGPAGTATSSMTFTTSVVAPAFASSVTKYATETQAYSYTFTTTGGSNPTSYSLAGSFPGAIALNTATGAHIGTPASGDAGTYQGTVTGVNTGGSGTGSYTLVVLGMPVLSPGITAPGANSGTGYSLTVPVTGLSLGTLSYVVSSGVLPAGLSLNSSTGVISGTPTQTSSSTVSFTVAVTNLAGTTVSSVITLPVTAPITASSAVQATGANSSATASVAIAVTGGANGATGAATKSATPQQSTKSSGEAEDSSRQAADTDTSSWIWPFVVTALALLVLALLWWIIAARRRRQKEEE